MTNSKEDCKDKKEYIFGGIEQFDLEKIESEVLNESMYLEVFAGSDERFKTNITPLSGALTGLIKLEAVSYDWNTELFKDKGFTAEKQIGLIAQDVKKVFPAVVKEDSDGYLTVNYSKMVPPLLEGIKEMKKLISDQANELKLLSTKVTELESRL
ncbi:MAG: tail fiber domain-containing protein [Bacteriovoracaceae bacterium]|nr:tail fiber domain-containing protein [Bacteriovoracaceae bacterium]